jgi:hypothetical protein
MKENPMTTKPTDRRVWRLPVRIATAQLIERYAVEHGCSVADAVDRIIEAAGLLDDSLT